MKNQKSTPFNDFISFREFISLAFIQVIYGLGAVLISIYGIVVLSGGQSFMMGGQSEPLLGIGIIFLGNILWRLVCEAWILFFRLADSVSNIEAKVNKLAGTASSPNHSQEIHQPGGAPWLCPKCQTSNLGNTYKCSNCGYSLV